MNLSNVRVSIFLAAFAAKQRRNVALFAPLRALRETKIGHYLNLIHYRKRQYLLIFAKNIS